MKFSLSPLSVFFCIFIFVGVNSSAQSSKPKGTVEIRVMGNLANVVESDGVNIYNYSGLLRQNVGLLGHVPINKKFWVLPGLFYNWAGASSNDFDLHLNYLNVPLFLKYVPAKNGVIELYAGPQFGLLLKTVATANQPYGNGNGDVSRFFNNTDISAVGGISVVPPKTPLVIMVQYAYSLTDIADHAIVPGSNSLKNRIFSFGIGYRF